MVEFEHAPKDCLAFLLQVRVPLGFLSSHSVTHRVVLLSGFSVALLVLLGWMGRQVWQIRNAGRWKSLMPPDAPGIE